MKFDHDEIAWTWQGKTVRLGVNQLGAGPTLLLLPALSSISTRGEMLPLQERLAGSFSTVAVDWPGFGDKPRPQVNWRTEIYRAFVNHLITEVTPRPFATIAAGHAAGYVIIQAADAVSSAGRLCLIAPTWRGPLPTLWGKRLSLFDHMARVGDLPILGGLLYWLNTNSFMIAMMARGHVYSDAAWLTPARFAKKSAVVRSPGARHASFRFITGMLDPVQTREEFLATASQVRPQVLVIYGAGTPRNSKAEMDALAALPNMQVVVLRNGKLSVHEEFAEDVAYAIETFLAQELT